MPKPDILRYPVSGGLNLAVPQALPTSLEAQALGKIAPEEMLPEMNELAVKIDPGLAAHVVPAAAEGVILGQVAARIRIDRAVEESPVEMRLRLFGGPSGT